MRRGTLWLGLPILVLAVGLSPYIPTVRAQSQGKQPSEQQQQSQQPQQQPGQQKSNAFVGQIVKAKNGQFALLVDKQAGTGFYLDDQDKAQKFEGQNVKVIGTLDAAHSMIHVSDIQPA
jgi:hypothetical protein